MVQQTVRGLIRNQKPRVPALGGFVRICAKRFRAWRAGSPDRRSAEFWKWDE